MRDNMITHKSNEFLLRCKIVIWFSDLEIYWWYIFPQKSNGISEPLILFPDTWHNYWYWFYLTNWVIATHICVCKLDHHFCRKWLVAWWYQGIAWINASMLFYAKQLIVIGPKIVFLPTLYEIRRSRRLDIYPPLLSKSAVSDLCSCQAFEYSTPSYIAKWM